MEEITRFELTKGYLERFTEAVEAREDGFIISTLEGVNPADITAILYEFNTEDSKYVTDLLSRETTARIIRDLDEDTRVKFFKAFTTEEIASIIVHLASDDAVDIINELPSLQREQVLEEIEDPEKQSYIRDLLHYDEDIAGGLMAKELIKANVNWTITQCIEEIRRQAEKVQKIYSVYVVDNKGKLKGRVSLKKIILADDNVKISNIYEPELVAVETLTSQEEVAMMMAKYDLEAIPVVNVTGKLVGRITIDDVVDVINEIAEEERQLMAGISSDVEETDSIWLLSKARLPWLMIGIAGGLVGAQFMELFEDDLLRITAIAFFIPLIQATGGNVGIQSSSIVVQSLANPAAFKDSIAKRLVKVFLVAILNGIVLSGLVFGVNLLVGGDFNLSAVVSLALFCVVLIASFMGTVTPLVLERFGINPALASGPFITTTNDLLGLGIYFYTVHILL